MRGSLVFVAITVSALAGCGQSPEQQLEAKARAGLHLVLKDPETAQFSDLTEHNGALCGFVNAKNSMGGYEGFQAFFVKDDQGQVDTDEHDVGFAREFDANCPLELSTKQLDMAVKTHTAKLKELSGAAD